jgi:hypothetical protein
MKCELCQLPMGKWGFSKDIYHCPNCGNIVIEDE